MYFLIALIIVVNVFSGIILIRHFSKSKIPTNHLFGIPGKIVLHDGDKQQIIEKNETVFDEILKQNEFRKKTVQHFNELDSIDAAQIGQIYIEYLYENQYSTPVMLQLEEKIIVTDRICFILTGEHNTKVCIYTNNGILTIGNLNANAELIDLVRGLLSTDEIETQNKQLNSLIEDDNVFKFAIPDQIIIVEKSKTSKLTSKDDQFQTVLDLLVKNAKTFDVCALIIDDNLINEVRNNLYVELIYNKQITQSFPRKYNPQFDEPVNKIMIPLTGEYVDLIFIGEEKYTSALGPLNIDVEIINISKQYLE